MWTLRFIPASVLSVPCILGACAWIACSDTPDAPASEPSGPSTTQGDGGHGTTTTSSGATCTVTAQCPAGSHCGSSHVCESQCTPGGGGCGSGQECTDYGSCVHTQPSGADGVCAAKLIEASLTTPTVVILVDQSGSMDTGYSGGTRWSVLRDALIHPQNGVIARLQSQVRFGLTLYTSHSGGEDCPVLRSVQPALNSLASISATYSPAGPDGDTPTGDSINALVATLRGYAEPGPKYIVLATDGEPDTCEVPNPQNGQAEAIAAAKAAHNAGIDLFILSVGQGDVSLKHLQDMANAGVGLRVGGTEKAPFYEPNDQAQLAAAFDAIIGRVLSCVVTVNGTIDPAAEAYGVVYLDGDAVPWGGTNGWERVDSSSIRLKGSSCERAQSSGSHTLSVMIPCNEIAG